MNQTLREVIDNITIKVVNATGKSLDQSSIQPSTILFELLTNRVYLLKEKRYKGREYTEYDIQTIPCIPLQEAGLSECPWMPIKSSIRRTVEVLPKPLLGKFEVITTIEGQETLDYIRWEDISAYNKNRFDFGNFPFYTIQNVNEKVHLYIGGTKHLQGIAAKLIAVNPSDVWNYKCCNDFNNPYKDILDQIFPLDEDLVKICIALTVEGLVKKINKGDIDQNNTDNLVVPNSEVK